MYYAKFAENGERITSIVSGIHFNTKEELATYIADGFVRISQQEQKLYTSGKYLRDAEGRPVEKVMPEASLEEIKNLKWQEIKMIRSAKEGAPFSYLGKSFDCNWANLVWAVEAARSAFVLGKEFSLEWTCTDNTSVVLVAEDFVNIALIIAKRAADIHKKSQQYRVQIESASTTEEVEAIVWQD